MSDTIATPNDNLVLVVGQSASGKSMCFKDIPDQENYIYLNCEAGKRLPFKNNFKRINITDPLDVFNVFEQAEEMDDIKGIIIDSLTYLMDMYESLYVVPRAGTKEGMTAWSDYAQYFKSLMQQYVAASSKAVIMTAHTADVVNGESIKEHIVKIKGSTMNNGVESYFSQIVACKKVRLDKIKHKNDMLTLSPREERLGYKHVFQTDTSEDTINERIRSAYGMWEEEELYIDNNIVHVLNRIHEYYGE